MKLKDNMRFFKFEQHSGISNLRENRNFLTSKNSQEAGTSFFTVSVIISILVLISAIAFFASPKILEWVKNLPGNAGPIDNSSALSADEQKLLGYALVGYIHNAAVDIPQFGGKEKYIDFIFHNDIRSAVETPIYLANDKVNNDLLYGDIYVGVNWAFDLKIGKIEADRVSITISQADYEDYLAKHSDSGLPTYALINEQLNSSKNIRFFLYKTISANSASSTSDAGSYSGSLPTTQQIEAPAVAGSVNNVPASVSVNTQTG